MDYIYNSLNFLNQPVQLLSFEKTSTNQRIYYLNIYKDTKCFDINSHFNDVHFNILNLFLIYFKILFL